MAGKPMYLLRNSTPVSMVGSAGPFSLGPVCIKVFDYPTIITFGTQGLAERFRERMALDPSYEVAALEDWLRDPGIEAIEERPRHAIHFDRAETMDDYFGNPADFDYQSHGVPLE
ncbi:MAG: hypothetical protein SF172_02445 [Burkholderiales bacterium]|nr:hypothetical protein [Burkholderiales bacterium]